MTDAYLDELKRARAEMAKLIEKYSGLEPSDLMEAFETEIFATEPLLEDTPNE